MKTLTRKNGPQEAAPSLAAATTRGAEEAALFEALWRAEELAAAFDAAEREIAGLEGKLARAEETIAELTEIGDAAQAAIDQLRARLTKREAEARRFAGDRAALAAELYDRVRRAANDLDAVGGELFRALRERAARSQPSHSQRGQRQGSSASLRFLGRLFLPRRARRR